MCSIHNLEYIKKLYMFYTFNQLNVQRFKMHTFTILI